MEPQRLASLFLPSPSRASKTQAEAKGAPPHLVELRAKRVAKGLDPWTGEPLQHEGPRLRLETLAADPEPGP